MAKHDIPMTPAVRLLRDNKISFIPHPYTYVDRGGTAHSALELGVDEHAVIKTIVLESDPKTPLIMLMHGDYEVSTKQLARILGVKQIVPCTEASVTRVTGYMTGGCSPFGTRTRVPVYAEASIFTLPKIYINGGKRGFLVEIDPNDLRRVLDVTDVHAAVTTT